MPNFAVERVDHLGIVAGICQEIGLVEYCDELDEQARARVTLGQAVLAMVQSGLGFRNRRLYLVPQYFAHKPVEQLIGPGITPADLNDDCLGRALDWLTAHAPFRTLCWACPSGTAALCAGSQGRASG